jgi:hypothetical protein
VTHDPLCTWRQAEEADAGDPRRWLAGGLAVCDCLKIAEVREDERDNAWSSVAEIHAIELWDGVNTAWWIVKADALTAIAATKGEKP